MPHISLQCHEALSLALAVSVDRGARTRVRRRPVSGADRVIIWLLVPTKSYPPSEQYPDTTPYKCMLCRRDDLLLAVDNPSANTTLTLPWRKSPAVFAL